MSYGDLPREPRPPLVAVWPGPVLKVWMEGIEVASVPLTHSAALVIAGQLLTAVSTRLPHETNTPNENLWPADHIARRNAERAK